MKINDKGQVYSSECHIVKDNEGTVAVHIDDIVDGHYLLLDTWVYEYCLYHLYRPLGVKLKDDRKSLFGTIFDRWIEGGDGYSGSYTRAIDVNVVNNNRY